MESNLADVVCDREMARETNIKVGEKSLMRLLYTLECSISNTYKAQEGCWNYIPYSHLVFYKNLLSALKDKPIKKMNFLEMGCGFGTKLHIASHWLGFKLCDGVEINPTYAEIAKRMTNGSVYCCDVRDFEKYKYYDVIYTYGEVKKKTDDGAVVKKVGKEMKEGAFLFEAFAFSPMIMHVKEDGKLRTIGQAIEGRFYGN